MDSGNIKRGLIEEIITITPACPSDMIHTDCDAKDAPEELVFNVMFRRILEKEVGSSGPVDFRCMRKVLSYLIYSSSLGSVEVR